jgi:hypothetical protein
VFTIDRNDFETYRVQRGHRQQAIQIVSLSTSRWGTPAPRRSR